MVCGQVGRTCESVYEFASDCSPTRFRIRSLRKCEDDHGDRGYHGTLCTCGEEVEVEAEAELELESRLTRVTQHPVLGSTCAARIVRGTPCVPVLLCIWVFGVWRNQSVLACMGTNTSMEK